MLNKKNTKSTKPSGFHDNPFRFKNSMLKSSKNQLVLLGERRQLNDLERYAKPTTLIHLTDAHHQSP